MKYYERSNKKRDISTMCVPPKAFSAFDLSGGRNLLASSLATAKRSDFEGMFGLKLNTFYVMPV
jgi:hypothetical protein